MLRWHFSIILGCLLTSQLFAAGDAVSRPIGVYRAGYEDKGEEHPRSDDGTGTIRLGKLVSDELKDIEILSISNDNELFRMNFKSRVPTTTDPDFRYMAVCINNCVMPIWSQTEPKSPNTLTQLGARIQGKAVMQKIADAYSVKPKLRKHPGHKYMVHWILEKKNMPRVKKLT